MKTISVINLKGGVAKTTTSINLSTLLGDRWGRRVLLIDNDKQGNTSQFFGKYIKDATCGSARILQGEEPVIFTTNHGIDLINANMSLETAENKLLKSNERQDVKMKQFLEGKANQYDFCIIDNPPAVGMCVINALCASDEVIVPVKLDNWAIDGTEMITATIEQLKALNKGYLVANALNDKQAQIRAAYGYNGKEIKLSWNEIAAKAAAGDFTGLNIGDYKDITLTTGESVRSDILKLAKEEKLVNQETAAANARTT